MNNFYSTELVDEQKTIISNCIDRLWHCENIIFLYDVVIKNSREIYIKFIKFLNFQYKLLL